MSNLRIYSKTKIFKYFCIQKFYSKNCIRFPLFAFSIKSIKFHLIKTIIEIITNEAKISIICKADVKIPARAPP